MQNVEEVWRVAKYNDEVFEDYEVSSLGRVRSYKRSKTPRILKRIEYKSSGYFYAKLYKDKKQYQCSLHRLVICSHQDLPENWRELQVDHISCDRADNRICNLRWVTPKQNTQHAVTNGKLETGYKKAKQVWQFSLEGELIATFHSTYEIEKKLGFDNRQISQCCLGRLKTYKSYRWSYSPTLD